ncbi:putative nucleotidyltransferase, ribonuclease H [Tanacetum coccineum]
MPFGLCNAPATFQRCMTAIFHELIKDSMEVFMDNFSVFGNSFDHCLKNLEKMLKRYEETNLVLNWEKCHFMVKEGIVLVHKVSRSGIKVDKGKVKAISKLPYPVNVKSIRSFLEHAGFYRRFIKDFSQVARPMTQLLAPIMIKPDWSLPFEVMYDASDYAVGAVLGQRIDKHFKHIHYANKTMNEAQENYTTTEKELLAVVFAFDKFCQYLVLSKTIIRDKKGAKNLAVDHLSWLENPDLGKLTKAEIRDLFPKEQLMAVSNHNNEPWCVAGDEAAQILQQCHSGPSGGHHGIATTIRKVFEAGFYWPHIFRDACRYLCFENTVVCGDGVGTVFTSWIVKLSGFHSVITTCDSSLHERLGTLGAICRYHFISLRLNFSCDQGDALVGRWDTGGQNLLEGITYGVECASSCVIRGILVRLSNWAGGLVCKYLESFGVAKKFGVEKEN